MPEQVIGFAVSGMKYYENDFYKNSPSSFMAFSVTGTKCECRCAHCDAGLLRSMTDVSTIEKFTAAVDAAASDGCTGILVSGGSDAKGSVPLLPFISSMSYAKVKGLKVLVHTGLLDEDTAYALKSANVDQVLLDVIGSEKTIRSVYGINKKPEDYFNSMLYCKNVGLKIAPHLVIGLDFGMIDGEYNAIDLISRAEAENAVFVVLTPKRHTRMENAPPPRFEDVLDVFAYASGKLKRGRTPDSHAPDSRAPKSTVRDDGRVPAGWPLNVAPPHDKRPKTRISLGCARPHVYSVELEKAAVDLGFSSIAYPHEETIRYTQKLGIKTVFYEECCSLHGVNGGIPVPH